LDEGQVVGSEFVVASGDATTSSDLIEKPFSQIARTVEMRTEA
jgi:hypothetical protein